MTRLVLLAVCLSVVTAGFFGESVDSQLYTATAGFFGESVDSQLYTACCKEKDKAAKCLELLKGGEADPTREFDGKSTLTCAAADDNVEVVVHLVEKDDRYYLPARLLVRL
jgi:hypothetical protein